MVAHVYNLSLQLKQVNSHEFEVSVGWIVSFRSVWDI